MDHASNLGVQAAVGLVAASALAATALMPIATAQAQRQQQAGSSFTVAGVARGSGGLMRNSVVNVALHSTKLHAARLDYDKTGGNARFILSIDRSPQLARYAQRHRGFVNLDLAIMRGKKLFMRAVHVPYDSQSTNLGSSKFSRVSYESGSDRPQAARGVLPNSMGVWNAPVMMIEHAPDEHTSFTFKSGSENLA